MNASRIRGNPNHHLAQLKVREVKFVNISNFSPNSMKLFIGKQCIDILSKSQWNFATAKRSWIITTKAERDRDWKSRFNLDGQWDVDDLIFATRVIYWETQCYFILATLILVLCAWLSLRWKGELVVLVRRQNQPLVSSPLQTTCFLVMPIKQMKTTNFDKTIYFLTQCIFPSTVRCDYLVLLHKMWKFTLPWSHKILGLTNYWTK